MRQINEETSYDYYKKLKSFKDYFYDNILKDIKSNMDRLGLDNITLEYAYIKSGIKHTEQNYNKIESYLHNLYLHNDEVNISEIYDDENDINIKDDLEEEKLIKVLDYLEKFDIYQYINNLFDNGLYYIISPTIIDYKGKFNFGGISVGRKKFIEKVIEEEEDFLELINSKIFQKMIFEEEPEYINWLLNVYDVKIDDDLKKEYGHLIDGDELGLI